MNFRYLFICIVLIGYSNARAEEQKHYSLDRPPETQREVIGMVGGRIMGEVVVTGILPPKKNGDLYTIVAYRTANSNVDGVTVKMDHPTKAKPSTTKANSRQKPSQSMWFAIEVSWKVPEGVALQLHQGTSLKVVGDVEKVDISMDQTKALTYEAGTIRIGLDKVKTD
ncbi:MAG: hypothetical protein ABSG67_21135 [Thermoguttaceae bacterium]|jgi:hypothetical protein